jgi:hypothetical protein
MMGGQKSRRRRRQEERGIKRKDILPSYKRSDLNSRTLGQKHHQNDRDYDQEHEETQKDDRGNRKISPPYDHLSLSSDTKTICLSEPAFDPPTVPTHCRKSPSTSLTSLSTRSWSLWLGNGVAVRSPSLPAPGLYVLATNPTSRPELGDK